MSEAKELAVEIAKSINAILDKTDGRRKPTPDLIGDINNDACDLHHNLLAMSKLIEAELG
jgi:hypothetical protein